MIDSTCGQARLIYGADVREALALLPDQSVNCVVTSPPYWHQRSYLPKDDPLAPLELGHEADPLNFISGLRDVFREVRRILRKDGVLWVNMGDSYAGSRKGIVAGRLSDAKRIKIRGMRVSETPIPRGLKPKDLIGIPWRLALALQADGWYLRSDVVWSKTNPVPQGVFDRPLSSHEYLFMLTRSRRYWWDAEAVMEPSADGTGRLRRSVWTAPSVPSRGKHAAPMPPDVIRPCVLSSCPSGGIVLDPFSGSGTVGRVALSLGRSYVGIDLDEAQLPDDCWLW